MENAGCITFSEIYLAVGGDREVPQIMNQWISVQIHELIHQWFGNYVTASWWGDAFLHEAFATFLSWHIMLEVFPTEFPEVGVSFQVSQWQAQEFDTTANAVGISREV